MKASVTNTIELKISKLKQGQLFLPSDFKNLGTSTAIRKILSRMTTAGKIERIAQGIYVTPKRDEVFGKVLPSIDDIVATLAEKEHIIIKPSGQYALNKVGLSSQVPMKQVYLTTGHSKKIQVGKSTIIFKSTTAKKLSMKGDITSLLFLGLEEIDLKSISKLQLEKIRELIKKDNAEIVKFNLRLVSAKVSDFIIKNSLNNT